MSRGEDAHGLGDSESVELAVKATFTPLFTERCECQTQGERGRQAFRRIWQQIAVSAGEAGVGRQRNPGVLHGASAFGAWLADFTL